MGAVALVLVLLVAGTGLAALSIYSKNPCEKLIDFGREAAEDPERARQRGVDFLDEQDRLTAACNQYLMDHPEEIDDFEDEVADLRRDVGY